MDPIGFVVYNFSHPLSTDQINQIIEILNRKFQKPVVVREKRFNFHVDFSQNVPNQVLTIVENAMRDCTILQTDQYTGTDGWYVLSPDNEIVLLRPPAMTEGTYLTILWYLMQFLTFPIVPAFMQLREGTGMPKFVVYDVINLNDIFHENWPRKSSKSDNVDN